MIKLFREAICREMRLLLGEVQVTASDKSAFIARIVGDEHEVDQFYLKYSLLGSTNSLAFDALNEDNKNVSVLLKSAVLMRTGVSVKAQGMKIWENVSMFVSEMEVKEL